MDKNLLQEEFEQAKKRGGADYAKGYVEGLSDGYQQALQQCHVSRRLSADDMTELIDRHIARMWGGLEMESVKYWIETGRINGNFRLRLLAMLQFADWKLERLEKANGG